MKFKDSKNSWTVDVRSIDKTTYDLSAENSNKAQETELRDNGRDRQRREKSREIRTVDTQRAGTPCRPPRLGSALVAGTKA